MKSVIEYLLEFYSAEEISTLTGIGVDELDFLAEGRVVDVSEEVITSLMELYVHSRPRVVRMEDLPGLRFGNEVLIHTPDGMQPVGTFFHKGIKESYSCQMDGMEEVTTSADHLWETPAGWVSSGKMTMIPDGMPVLCSDGRYRTMKTMLAGTTSIVDIEVIHRNHRYYADDRSCHNSGVGKSFMLANIALNFAERKKNVIYITMELSEDLVAKRFDSMVSGVNTRNIFKEIGRVSDTVRVKAKYHGAIWIKYLKSGSTVTDISAYIKQFIIQTGIVPDCLIVDYLDLLHPNAKIGDYSNLWVKDKYVTEELRSLVNDPDLKMYGFTASQMTRGAIDEEEHRQSMIAGGMSKVNTVDNLASLYQSQAMREAGVYKVQFLKTRSSAGVGKSVIIAFDPDTMRMRDASEEQVEMFTGSKAVRKPSAPQSPMATSSSSRVSALRQKIAGGRI